MKKLGAKTVKTMKNVHRYASLAIYVAAMAEVVVSFYTGWWKNAVDDKVWMAATALVLTTLATVILQVRASSGAAVGGGLRSCLPGSRDPVDHGGGPCATSTTNVHRPFCAHCCASCPTRSSAWLRCRRHSSCASTPTRPRCPSPSSPWRSVTRMYWLS